MQTITTIGFDIAKSVFQVHGGAAGGQVVIRRQLKRRYVLAFFQKLSPCLVGIEACASAHHWSRELQPLGHTVRLIPPAYVKPYVKRQKNDAADVPASVRCWPLLWSPPLLIQSPSDQGATSRPGSVLCRSSTRVEARTGSAISANKVTAICAACSWPARSLSSVTPRSMAPNIGPGSQPCLRGGRRRLRLSRSPTKSPEWSGP